MRIAVAQSPPVLLDRHRTLASAVKDIETAAAAGAGLILFPEAHVPGYPAWVWRLRPGADRGIADEIHARLLAHSVSLAGDDLAPLAEAARAHEVTVVCGINERDDRGSRSTLYNTVVVIGPDGSLVNRHRKLMPTNPERMVWGMGDASGLRVVDTACGRVGTLVCWENYMPLARYALYAQGVELYLAPTYDAGDQWIATLRHIAREGGCWVAAAGVALRGSDVPDDLPGRADLYAADDEWINPGDSVVIAPGGEIVAGPLHRETGLLYAEIDLARVARARRGLDVAGHYARPDVFDLRIDATPRSVVEIDRGD